MNISLVMKGSWVRVPFSAYSKTAGNPIKQGFSAVFVYLVSKSKSLKFLRKWREMFTKSSQKSSQETLVNTEKMKVFGFVRVVRFMF